MAIIKEGKWSHSHCFYPPHVDPLSAPLPCVSPAPGCRDKVAHCSRSDRAQEMGNAYFPLFK
jgi:hypothetical protein